MNNEILKQYKTRAARLEDAGDVADLMNICSMEITGKKEMTAEELIPDWDSSLFDLDKNTILVFDGKRLVGYADLWGVTPPFVRYYAWVRVHPQYRGKGIGWALNQWAEDRARVMLTKAPENTQVVLVSHVNARDHKAVDLLSAFDFEVKRYSWLMETRLDREIPAPVLPKNSKMRIANINETRDIYALQRRAFKDHWGYIETPFEEGFENFSNQTIKSPYYSPDLWFVVEADNELVAMVIVTKESSYGSNYGWIELLGVERSWRKRGLGEALLYQAFKALKEKGCTKAGLGVDAQSLTGATRLYEKVGMYVDQEYLRFEKVLREGMDLRTLEIQ